jgi:5-methylcytosine-specific restriction protein A|tara:strand:- start:50 stop:370 length:321 start_codon:yes stop_codon:yes gene_type:complete
MPNYPTAKKKPWDEKPRQMHARKKDMRWFYNSRTWRKFSQLYKQRNTLCFHCEQLGIYEPAKVTDHLKTYEEEPKGFDLSALNDKYMQPLCSSCHNKKSGREAHKK